MKLALAIAGEHALPSAFVVFRGFAESMRKAAALGYDGVELALKHPDEIDRHQLGGLLAKHRLEVSCISSGQVYASLGYAFTDADQRRRSELKKIFTGLVDLAADYGHMVNIGRVRGPVKEKTRDEADRLFIDLAGEICAYAEPKGVTLILEPVNRYEIDYVNSVEEGVRLLTKAGIHNLKLMPDVFHMNIEDAKIGATLEKYIDLIGYVHLADSNRHAPGDGHLDFDDVFSALKRAKYDGWCSVEILPFPDPDTAAQRAIRYVEKYFKA
jgi:sugar phosphate isomerase/epimerase